MLNVSDKSIGLGVTRRPTFPEERRPKLTNGHHGHTDHGHIDRGPANTGLRESVETQSPESSVSIVKHGSKRALDISIAIIGLLVLSPLMLVIAIIVAATSRGGAIFAHERVGRDGKRFRLYKFRSMRSGTSERVMNDPEVRANYLANDFKLDAKHDAITPVGRFLRKSSLDELPQLWNVLVGDMSVVGVRPLVPDEVAARTPHDQQLYCSFQPGLTGLWQVEGRSKIGGAERVELDRRYIEQWSFWGDVRILARTPIAVLRPANTH